MDIFGEWHPTKNTLTPDSVTKGSGRKVWWLGQCGHEWEAIVQNRVKGAGCPFCANKRLLPGFNDLAARFPGVAAEWHPTRNPTGPEEIMPGSKKRAWWLCGVCEREWETRIDFRTAMNTGCPSCRNRIRALEKSGTMDPALQEQWSPLNENPATLYSPHSNFKAWWVCEVGHEWNAPISRRTQGSGCPVCSGREVREGFNDLPSVCPVIAAEWHPTKNDRQVLSVTAGSGYRAWWKCEKGHEWQTDVATRVLHRTQCPYCTGLNPIEGTTDLVTTHPELVSEWHPTKNSKSPQEVSPGSGYRAWWVCAKGHEWQTQVCNRTGQNTGCRYCANNGTSRAEQELAEFVRSLGVRITTHNRKIAPGYEFDIAVPEKKIAIEYNGLYWHSEKHKPRNYHRDKMQAAQEAGWGVVYVWEDDPMPVIRSMLARKLGVSTEPRYNARSLQKGDVGRVEAREFLNANHVQGYSPGSVRLGLWEDNTLVALMLFRSRGEGVWELSRYATAGIVRGGFTRLLTTFVNEHRPTQVVSFSDNTVSDGGVYEQAGFTRDGEIAPDYSYLVGGRRVHKFNYRLNRFRTDPDLKFEPGLTEKELADLNGLPRIYDAGKVRWVLNNLC